MLAKTFCLFNMYLYYHILHSVSKWFAGIREIIGIPDECEGGIEKFVQRITYCHHKACWVMTNGDREGPIFLSHSHTNNGLVFLLPIYKNMKKASRKS